MYSISCKIIWLVSTLFGLNTTDKLYEFKYLYLNQAFSQIFIIKLFIYAFTIFVRLL